MMHYLMGLIGKFAGGLERLADNPLKLRLPGLMDLCIEDITLGGGPWAGGRLISVAHYWSLNGDAMRDPDLVVESDGLLMHPVSFQQDGLGVFIEAARRVGGVLVVNHQAVRDLRAWMAEWDAALAVQGWLHATPVK
jgi:hypothetical protein